MPLSARHLSGLGIFNVEINSDICRVSTRGTITYIFYERYDSATQFGFALLHDFLKESPASKDFSVTEL